MSARLPTGVSLRGSVYYIRVGLPHDIRHLWPRLPNGKLPTDAYRASLKTRNRDEAVTKSYKIIAEYRDQFAALRAASAPPPFVQILPALARRFAEEAQALAIQADAGNQAVSSAMLKDGNLDIARGYAERIAESWGIRADWSSPEGLACMNQIARSVVVVWQERLQDGSNEATESLNAPIHAKPPRRAQAPAKAPLTLRDVVPHWIRWNAPGSDAQGVTELALRRFEAAVGVVPLHQITKTTGSKFVAALLDQDSNIGRKTAGNMAAAITALVNIAVREDLLDRNPMDLSFDTSLGAKQRTPWNDRELAILFGCSLFSEHMDESYRWVAVEPNDARAILLLLLHTGARVGEIAQLRCEDFVTINGIAAIHITAEAGTVKTAESERYVPLADHLRGDPWFSHWLTKTMTKTGHAMPSLHGRMHTPAETYTRWFHKLRKELRLPLGHLYGTHKFRHWLRSALAAKDVNENTADSITGHAAQGSSGRRIYTASATLPAMLNALNRLDYPMIGHRPRQLSPDSPVAEPLGPSRTSQ
ncbi:tyrosine-type recombinase/integrase [Burkholderia vietnamiensis]|uniref:tyrosine-type recombinase/integrase n=1 Tax=Burkholderia vietnamiensis TaxID=60552 RepID=UPI0009BBAF95|nr:tyrosine-type recombinase/integrase [Burkholderia vietnamiensis]